MYRSETMGSLLRRTLFLSVAVVGLAVPAVGRAAEPALPKGFRGFVPFSLSHFGVRF